MQNSIEPCPVVDRLNTFDRLILEGCVGQTLAMQGTCDCLDAHLLETLQS